MVDAILAEAETLARDNRWHFIGTEHVLLAFLKHAETNGERALSNVIGAEAEAKLLKTMEMCVENPPRPVCFRPCLRAGRRVRRSS